jgi:hypothetical protein
VTPLNPRDLAQAIRELVPALVQVVGLLIFILTAVAWLGFGRAEPELMGIGITTACGGWLAQSIQERLAPPPRPPEHPSVPSGEPANGESSA